MSKLKLLSSLISVKSVLCSDSLSLWRYSQFCAAHLEIFVSGAFSEFFNMVKTSKKFIERSSIETLQLVVLYM